MTNLIPTARVDKNGRVVTRHMKPESSGHQAHSIPSPAPPQVSGSSVLKSGAFSAISEVVLSGSPSAYERGVLEEGLNDLPDETLEKIIELDGSDDYTRLWVVFDDMKKKAGRSSIIDLIHLSDMLEHRGVDEMVFSDYVRGFQQYKDLHPVGDNGVYPEERLAQCTLLTDAYMLMIGMIEDGTLNGDGDMAYVNDKGEWTPFLRDRELRNLLLASKYDPEKVLKLMKDRELIAPDSLIAILDQDINALRDGAL